MTEKFNVDSKAECDQHNIAHKTKTKNASAHTGSRSAKAVRKKSEDYEGKDLWKRWVLPLEWKADEW